MDDDIKKDYDDGVESIQSFLAENENYQEIRRDKEEKERKRKKKEVVGKPKTEIIDATFWVPQSSKKVVKSLTLGDILSKHIEDNTAYKTKFYWHDANEYIESDNDLAIFIHTIEKEGEISINLKSDKDFKTFVETTSK